MLRGSLKDKASRTAFRDLPIRRKLLFIMVATTATALLLAGIGIISADALLFRSYLRRDLSALARIVADNSTASLAFDYPRNAEEVLSALRARPHMMAACIYDADGSPFATYLRPDFSLTCPPPESSDRIHF